jgi:hypothetical protein
LFQVDSRIGADSHRAAAGGEAGRFNHGFPEIVTGGGFDPGIRKARPEGFVDDPGLEFAIPGEFAIILSSQKN